MRFVKTVGPPDRWTPAQFILRFMAEEISVRKIISLKQAQELFQSFVMRYKKLLGTVVLSKKDNEILKEFISRKIYKPLLRVYRKTAKEHISYKKYILLETTKITFPSTRFILYKGYIFPEIKEINREEDIKYEF